MTPRSRQESQRQYVERTLREDGRISAYDALYTLQYEDGAKCGITRLAAIVEQLRKDGWLIATSTEQGQLAVYRHQGYAPWADGSLGKPIGKARECPSCHQQHPVGTRCAAAAA